MAAEEEVLIKNWALTAQLVPSGSGPKGPQHGLK